MVYISEAHPDDGWQTKANEEEGVVYKTPKTMAERAKIAAACVKKMKLTFPCIIDDIKDTTGKAYSGSPSRICLVGRNGKILSASTPGPRGIDIDKIEKVLKLIISQEEKKQAEKRAGGKEEKKNDTDADPGTDQTEK